MNFMEWIGLTAILIIGIWLAIGVLRYLTMRSRDDIGTTWGAALQCILFWPLSFWQM